MSKQNQTLYFNRKRQALIALENALGRCEAEGLTVVKDQDVEDFQEGVVICIPNTYWQGNEILMYGEKENE